MEKKPLSKTAVFIFFLFFSIISTNAERLIYLLSYLWGVVFNYRPFWSLNELIVNLLPVLLMLTIYILITRIKDIKQFSLATFVVLLVSYFITFAYMFASRETYLWFAPLVLLVVGLGTLVLRFFWEQIFLKNKPQRSFFLFLVLVITFLFLAWDTARIGRYGYDFIHQLYLPFGNYLRAVTDWHFNLFFLDLSGFAFIIINASASVLALLLALLPQISVKAKKK